MLGSLEDPQGLNRYVYSRNNPLKYTDLDGRWIHIAAAALAGAVIKSVVYWNAHPGDWQGTIVHAAIGAGAGAFAAATFGTAALAMTAGETSMTAAVAGLGLGKTLVAGAISGVGGGFMERSISGPLCYLDAPGDLEAPTYSATEFGLDLAGGVIGATAGYGVGYVGTHIPAVKEAYEVARTIGKVTEPYAGVVLIEEFTSELAKELILMSLKRYLPPPIYVEADLRYILGSGEQLR